MPMRIIGRGRDSYVLAGYLSKRGKWTRQWSERYFVLTDKALFWFKKERGQIFGEERGNWVIDTIEVTEMNDKQCFKVVDISKGRETTLLRANSEHEYTIWSNALRDVVLNVGNISKTVHNRELSDDFGSSQQLKDSNRQTELSESQQPGGGMHAQHSDYTSDPDTPLPRHIDHLSTSYPPHTPTLGGINIPTTNRQMSDSSLISPRHNNNSDFSSSERHASHSSKPAPTLSSTALSPTRTVNRPNRSYSRARGTADSSIMPPPKSPVTRNRSRAMSSVGDVIDPLLIVILEKPDNSSVISTQMRPALFSNNKPSLNAVRRGNVLLGSGGQELVVARNVPWQQTIHVPGFVKDDILLGVLGDGSRVKVKHNELINSSGEKLFSIDDPYRHADVLIKWQRVKPNYSVAQAVNYSTFIVLPLIYFSLLVLYIVTQFDIGVLTDFSSLAAVVFSTQGSIVAIGSANAIYALTDAVRRANGNRQQRMWLFTFVSLHESLMPKITERSTSSGATLGTAAKNKLLSVIADSSVINQHSEMRSPLQIYKHAKPPTSPSSKQVPDAGRAAVSPIKLPVPKPSQVTRESSDTYSSEPHSGHIPGVHRVKQSSKSLMNSSVLVPISPSAGDRREQVTRTNSNRHLQRTAATPPPAATGEQHAAEAVSDDAMDDDDQYAAAVRGGHIDLDGTDVEYEPYNKGDSVPPAGSHSKRSSGSGLVIKPAITLNKTYDPIDTVIASLIEREKQAVNLYQTSSLPPMRGAAWGSWTEADLSVISVRGKTFTDDKKKIAAGISIFRLLHVDMFYSHTDKFTRVADRPDNYAYQYYSRYGCTVDPTTPDGKLNPLFIINFVYPGPDNRNMTITCYYVRQVRTANMLRQQQQTNSDDTGSGGASDSDVLALDRIAAYDKMLTDFLDGDDAYRDGRFKIIARIAEGSWVVKKGVGATPAILGRKIKQTYYYDTDRNIFELDVDISSSVVAGKILSLVKSAATSLTIDMTFILQGESYDELAESVMCGVRVAHVDLMKIQTVDQNATTYDLDNVT